ncbi:uncharacterized protein LOC135707872 [Ochlerotatus camptorhynchus]|uniref:uncharacterized protein LOC135707872 n=1 Tax=Ochlerotatus camptorhynchus TaxID=644619 RepID=UPI0031DFF1F2
MAATYQFPCCDCNESYDASVQCERCEEWYHFECVGVDESVAEVIWFCSACIGEDRSIRESLGAPGRTRILTVVIDLPSANAEGSSTEELREPEEKNKLDELEEENQRKFLELQRKQIARRKEALKRRIELRMIINEDTEDDSDSVNEEVEESTNRSGEKQPEEQIPKSLGAIPMVPRKRSTEDDIQDLYDRFKKLLEEKKPRKSAPKLPTTKKSTKRASNPVLPRPSFEKDDDALRSILGGGCGR